MQSLDVINGGSFTTTVTLSCTSGIQQPTVTAQVAAGQMKTVTTTWQWACDGVTITSSNGSRTHFDNIYLAKPVIH